jgi:hypothetical protein
MPQGEPKKPRVSWQVFVLLFGVLPAAVIAVIIRFQPPGNPELNRNGIGVVTAVLKVP